ncbi:MAG: UV DNA damage repair endonuclease UvsE [Phycisphaeraceae bacterium]
MNRDLPNHPPSQPPAPRLGLVCITTDQAIRFRAITRARWLRLELDEQHKVLGELYRANLARLLNALRYCDQHNIQLYRVTSNLFPLCDEPVGERVLDAMADRLTQVGRQAERRQVRVVAHPDQFVVLSSDRPEVIATSIHIMQRHARVFDLLGLPRSPWSALILHGGKGNRADTLERIVGELPAAVRTRLALENDERAYSANEILAVCRHTGTPMVFDAHHHVIKEGLDSFEHPSVAELVEASRETWPDPAWQLVHLSNGRTGIRDARHSELITTYPSAYEHTPWVEVEAKGKERAIAELRRIWPRAR